MDGTSVFFVVYGTPVAKGRPKFSTAGRFPKAYTPEKTARYENLVRLAYAEKYGGTMLDGELEIDIQMFFSIPKSKPKKVREKMLCGEIRPTTKPDVDNCVKSITDSLNSVAFADDSQIVTVHAEKWYGTEPRAEIRISRTAVTEGREQT